MRNSVLIAALLLTSTLPLAAADLPSIEAPVLPAFEATPVFSPYFSFGPTIGTTGLGLEAGYRMNEYFGARAQISYLGGFSHKGTINSGSAGPVDYTVKPDWLSGGLMLDVHPFANPFRITGGARIGSPNISASGNGTGTVTIGGTNYSGSVSLKGTLDYDVPIMPYLGIGVEGSPFGNNVTVGFDLGAFYTGSPSVRLRQTGGTVTVSQADLDSEAQKLTNDIKQANFFPLVQLSVKYRF
jgi:opacity protein-like surface antigen